MTEEGEKMGGIKGKSNDNRERGEVENMAEKEEDNEGNVISGIPPIHSVLSQEMVEKIFSYLSDLRDLNTVMLVCKTWNIIAEAPALWSWFKITKRSQLTLKRLQGCKEIAIGDPWSRDKEGKICWTGFCREILQHPGLKKITLHKSAHDHDTWKFSTTMIDADILTEVFTKMEEIEIHELGFDSRVAEGAVTKCVVNAILKRPNNLKKLALKGVYYRKGVDSVSLKIEILELNLHKDEASLLLKLMMGGGTFVTSLSLLGNLVLSQFEPDFVFGVFDKMKDYVLQVILHMGIYLQVHLICTQ